MRARRLLFPMLGVPTLVFGSFAMAAPVLAAPCDSAAETIGNGGFETPPVSPNTYTLFPEASVTPWQTTDGLGEIEIWGDGFLGVPAAEGNAFAEINANTDATLYQDVISTPGSTISWSLEHRGRDGDDTMQVLIGDADAADVNGSSGWDYTSPDFTDGNGAWGSHGDDYVVPAGQTCTRFGFRVVSTASGSPSIGNLLDAVAMTVTVPPEPTPTPTPAPTADPSGSGGVSPTSAPTAPPTDALVAADPRGSDLPFVGGALLILAALVSAAFLRVRLGRRR